jgi:NitT/TauT family transport system substrate-binding protein
MKTKFVHAVVAAICLFAPAKAFAFDVVVSQWGQGMYGAPFAIAKQNGFFKKENVDVTGFTGGEGGGTTLRNVLASPIPYGEVAVAAVIAAIQNGVDLTIVNAGVISLDDMIWITRPDAPINSVKDLKGKTLSYSNPKSVTDMVSILALEKAGIFNDVKRVATGGTGVGLTALREGAVDVTFIIEPVYSAKLAAGDRYKIAFTSVSLVPHMTQSVGVVRTDYLKEHSEQIRAIIKARCDGVQYIRAHPQEASEMLAREYKLAPAVAKSAIDRVTNPKTIYWSLGGFDYEGMDTVLNGMRRVKAIGNEPFDWSKVVDEQYLSAECKKK